MKFSKYNIAGIFLSATMLTSTISCEAVNNSNKTQRGVAIGTAAGAILGGILGNNVGRGGNGAAGAVLGGVLGGVAGGVLGKRMDNQAKEIKEILPGADVERVGDGVRVNLNENSINFDFNSTSLTSTSRENLDRLAEIFNKERNTDISAFGHTDNIGTDAVNDRISQQRAEAVVDYLVSRGVDRNRFTVRGMGKAEPIASNDTPEGRSQNRRVEFAIRPNQQMIEEAKTHN